MYCLQMNTFPICRCIFRQYFNAGGSEGPNCKNLAAFLQSYVQRSDLNLAREIAPNGKVLYGASSRALKSPVLNMTGDHSPHVEATVAFNGRLQPNKTTWMKIQVLYRRSDLNFFLSFLRLFQDAAMILEEQPSKVAEAVKLFLQGLGYTTVRSTKIRASSLAGTPVKRASNNAPAVSTLATADNNKTNTAELITGLQDLVLQQNN